MSAELRTMSGTMSTAPLQAHDTPPQQNGREPMYPLPLEDYRRYGRQMILDGFGLQGECPKLLTVPPMAVLVLTFNHTILSMGCGQ
jgi:hypothetical protein